MKSGRACSQRVNESHKFTEAWSFGHSAWGQLVQPLPNNGPTFVADRNHIYQEALPGTLCPLLWFVDHLPLNLEL